MDSISYNAPAGWTASASASASADRVVLTAPEGDLYVAVVSVAAAADAKSALAAAWASAEPGFARDVRLASPLPAANGWDERWNYDYLTSPAEKLIVQAVALRQGAHWTVVLLKGSMATADKRAGAIRLVLQSVRPQGYERETFAGRTAHHLDAARVGALKAFVQSSMQELSIPGASLALVDHGKIVFEGGFGVRELGKPPKVDAHTLFMIGSNTKSMTTLLLAELVDRHKLGWDEPVIEAYPGFRLGSATVTHDVKIKHLVCACTGLPREDLAMVFASTASTPPEQVFAQLAAEQPTTGFGEVFQYSNLLASAAGYVAAHVLHPHMEVGAGYDRSMQDLVFGPLRMADTTLSMPTALAADHASPHGMAFNGSTVPASIDPDNFVIYVRPGGGAWSSAHDMIRYVQTELNRGVTPDGHRLVSAENLLIRRKPGVSIGENKSYGMGLINDQSSGVTVIHHSGSTAGYKSDFFVMPEADVGAVILTNSDGGAALLGPFMRRLLEVLYDGKPEAAASVAAAAKQMRADMAEQRSELTVPTGEDLISNLATHYSNPELGRLEVLKSSPGVVFHFNGWSSPVGARKNKDGTVSFVTIDPTMNGFEFQIKKATGADLLVTREGQREYVYAPDR